MSRRVPIVAMLVLAAMAAAGAADQPRPSGPSPPPADTNAIETLTPDQARGLVAGFKGVEVTIAVGGPREGRGGPASRAVGLPLDGLKTIDAETATALAAFAGLRLELDGLTAIDAATAAALARFGGASLHLNGLEQIDADAAAALARTACLRLDVGGIARRTALDTPESVAVLRLLAAPCVTADGRLHLPALARLSPAVAEALVAMDQWSGELPGLTAFEAADSVAVAKALAARKGTLRLPHIKPIFYSWRPFRRREPLFLP